MRTLILGTGEIGTSLARVLSRAHVVYGKDKEGEIKFFDFGSPVPATSKNDTWDVLNICYPPSKDFVKITKVYIAQYKPKVTIIHSTVAPGTTIKCGPNVVHSPIHGKHPDISKAPIA